MRKTSTALGALFLLALLVGLAQGQVRYELPGGAASSITGGGSTLTASASGVTLDNGQILAPDGTVSAPAYAFTSGTNFGFYKDGTGIHWTATGTEGGRFTNAGLIARVYVALGASADVRLGFLSSGVGQIYSGTVGEFRDLKLRKTIFDPQTFASLSALADGEVAWCSDCNVASPCTSGGSGAWMFGSGGVHECPF